MAEEQLVTPSIVGVPGISGLILLGGVGFAFALASILAVAALEFFVAQAYPRSGPCRPPQGERQSGGLVTQSPHLP